MQTKPGYILFVLFAILSLCMTLVTAVFMKGSSYYQLATLITNKEKANKLSLSTAALVNALCKIEEKKEKTENSSEDTEKKPTLSKEQELMSKILPFFNKTSSFNLQQSIDGLDATVQIYLCSEWGKLNINTLYDIAHKKFYFEGQSDDRKKLSQWLFDKIAKMTGQSSLFEPFVKHMATRTTEFNDVLELLEIPEFEKAFSKKLFIDSNQAQIKTIYLTDLFTTSTNTHTINPWFLSASWCLLLDFAVQKSLSQEDQKKLIMSLKTTMNWQQDWNLSLKILYQKDYRDIPEEIKSMLTTHFEANIFSLLLKTKIKETTATIFTILKAKQVDNEQIFDIVKSYQV